MNKRVMSFFSIVLVSMGFATAAYATQGEDHKIDICHNGHVISVDVAGLNGHGDHEDDIIPATPDCVRVVEQDPTTTVTTVPTTVTTVAETTTTVTTLPTTTTTVTTLPETTTTVTTLPTTATTVPATLPSSTTTRPPTTLAKTTTTVPGIDIATATPIPTTTDPTPAPVTTLAPVRALPASLPVTGYATNLFYLALVLIFLGIACYVAATWNRRP